MFRFIRLSLKNADWLGFLGGNLGALVGYSWWKLWGPYWVFLVVALVPCWVFLVVTLGPLLGILGGSLRALLGIFGGSLWALLGILGVALLGILGGSLGALLDILGGSPCLFENCLASDCNGFFLLGYFTFPEIDVLRSTSSWENNDVQIITVDMTQHISSSFSWQQREWSKHCNFYRKSSLKCYFLQW